MLESLYLDADTAVHRMRAGWKLLVLIALGSALFVFESLSLVAAAGVAVAGAYAIARIPLAVAWRQMKFAVPLLIIIFAAQIWLAGWTVALLVVLRFAVLILAASLVTLTTRSADMIDAIEYALMPLSRLGVDTAKISLTLALAIRFIPLVVRMTRQVREAQRARGLERNLFAVAVPVIIRLLRSADDIADAIEARSFGSAPAPAPTVRS